MLDGDRGSLAGQDRRGVLRIADPELAAWQFLGMCNHPVLVGVMLGGQKPPDAARIETIARAAVTTFYAAYGPADAR